MQAFRAAVARVDDLTHDVRALGLSLIEPAEISFRAGQFVSFSVAAPDRPHPLTRPYSICSPPRETRAIQLLFNLVMGGPGSTFLYALEAGDTVEFTGTAGTFVLRPDDEPRRLLFVAHGTGIAPIRSMLLDCLPRRLSVRLLWGLRSERDLYFQEELSALAAAHPEFSFEMSLSQPSDTWAGARGRVQTLVGRELQDAGDTAVYVCGSSSLIGDVRSAVRAARAEWPVRWEQYYRGADADADAG